MVQMKVMNSTICFLAVFFLYIPHGSDESYVTTSKFIKQSKLYIPHGSDESGDSKKSQNRTVWIFISHMVQMKG